MKAEEVETRTLVLKWVNYSKGVDTDLLFFC
jgi:hypothetical protein